MLLFFFKDPATTKIYTDVHTLSLHDALPSSKGGETETLAAALPDDVEQAAERVLELACDRELTLATAESCTGGLLGSLLTDVEGASHAFERGFIVYSTEAKCELLGVDRRQIDDCGAVSRDVAIAMAEGAIRASRADIALAGTGFAGAGPAPALGPSPPARQPDPAGQGGPAPR